jgi:Tol biopolymer transport system component
MRWFDEHRMRLVLVGFVVAVMLGGNIAKADFTFGEPMNLGPTVNSSVHDEEPGISEDGLSIYFSSRRAGGCGEYDMWVTGRATTQDDWGPPVNLGAIVNSSSDDFSEDISADGLELYFASNRFGGMGDSDIWVAKRTTTQDDWTMPVNLGSMINSSSGEGCPSISNDGLELYFWTNRAGGSGSFDMWVSRRTTIQDDWIMAENLGPVSNSATWDLCTDVSPDGLLLVFVSARPGGYGVESNDLWMMRWPAIGEPWGLPVNLGPIVNTSGNENGPCISADGSILYFSSNRPGGYGLRDMWQASIEPVCDLNDDGIVDAADMCLMIDHWGIDNSLCDIGPMPWGDGVVDVQDLIVLAEHLFEGAGLVVHWALDETEGDVAYDSAGNIDATVYNGQWSTGKVDGALLFNGLTTYMDCSDSLRLGTRKTTLAMWLEPQHMGGMRYVLSRARGGASDFDYVLMQHLEGQVEFAVAQVGSEPVSVMSNATTPLNEWTHVAVCLDGSEAAIYINGQLDASAGYGRRIQCDGCRLWISSLGGVTRFYNGKIDDIRIYNVAMTAEQIGELAQ